MVRTSRCGRDNPGSNRGSGSCFTCSAHTTPHRATLGVECSYNVSGSRQLRNGNWRAKQSAFHQLGGNSLFGVNSK